ncbi:TonB-dependent receptor plug domain-containing protein [Croceicoccus sp. F390]|uniref:TonB-dependent receptor plug domain-containing protein n=1 Tax=Croceicoccus esteveae TaxID=3075597 RepID=A0ABU2ZH57_9SPHN|nr:TonB-dependent receptor plug domain-containing protein [Croceicoccus sp. F390]MDT0575935.1 TonB-dependent receptor plug domain-containing protein [Croceicoccus sp. F390]
MQKFSFAAAYRYTAANSLAAPFGAARLGAAGLVAVGLVTPAVASSQPAAVTGRAASDDIVVTAKLTPRALSQVGQSVTIVDEATIVARQATDVIDIIRTVPGLSVDRNGGMGTTAGVSIRGAESDQTVVLIDGVKLNDPASPGSGFNFGPLVAGNVARVEVVRGAQSVLYGSQAIGGVVNLITREPTQQPGGLARVEHGARDTSQLTGNLASRLGPVAASIGATFLRTDGISAFNRTRGGAEKDGFENLGLNGKVRAALTDGAFLDLRGFYADSTVDVDGFTGNGFGDTEQVSYREDLVAYRPPRCR